MSDQNDDPTIGGEPTTARRKMAHAPVPSAAGLSAAALPDADAKQTRSEDDPRERAARRAAEILAHRGNMDDGDDEFFIDPGIIPEGWTYEWKRHTTFGKEDPSYQVSIARAGWEAVPAYRHPEMMPGNYEGNTIERKGMLLMERPAEITAMARAAELRKARSQVRQKEVQLHGAPAGENSPFARDNDGQPLVKIKKSYEPMPIPKE